jgi:hypothetical protein
LGPPRPAPASPSATAAPALQLTYNYGVDSYDIGEVGWGEVACGGVPGCGVRLYGVGQAGEAPGAVGTPGRPACPPLQLQHLACTRSLPHTRCRNAMALRHRVCHAATKDSLPLPPTKGFGHFGVATPDVYKLADKIKAGGGKVGHRRGGEGATRHVPGPGGKARMARTTRGGWPGGAGAAPRGALGGRRAARPRAVEAAAGPRDPFPCARDACIWRTARPRPCLPPLPRPAQITREAGPVKGGQTVIAFAEDPTGDKWELIQRAKTEEPLCQVGWGAGWVGVKGGVRGGVMCYHASTTAARGPLGSAEAAPRARGARAAAALAALPPARLRTGAPGPRPCARPAPGVPACLPACLPAPSCPLLGHAARGRPGEVPGVVSGRARHAGGGPEAITFEGRAGQCL